MTTVEDWGNEFHAPPRQEGTSWPVDDVYAPHDRLKRVLAGSARYHARQTMVLFVSEDHDECLQAAISAGCAVELLTKAYLASVEHTLLAEKGDRDSVLVLAGKGHLASTGPTGIKTVGALEALKIAKYLYPTLSYNFQPSDQLVFKVRNAAAHMALVDRKELRTAMIVMCRLVDSLLVPLGLDREKFWGPYALPVVVEMLDQAQNEARRVTVAKLVAAGRRIATLTLGLDATNKALVLASLAGRSKRFSDTEQPHTCPLCGQQGWLICTVSTDSDADEGNSWEVSTAYPFAFQCPVCALDLRDDEMVGLGFFPSEIALDDESYAPGEVF